MDTCKLYDDPAEFFALYGSAKMRLTRRAAAAVARQCARRGLLVAVSEAGIFREPTFEARTDGVWMPKPNSKTSIDEAATSNETAARCIEDEIPLYNAFILTTAPIVATKLEDDLDLLLCSICVEIGFCNHLAGEDLLQVNSVLTAENFARAVLLAEKMNPDSETRWMNSLQTLFTDRYGASTSTETFAPRQS